MEKTEKQKRLIIIHLTAFLLAVLVIFGLFFFYLFPNIREIQEIKNSAYNTFTDLNTIEKR
jgi:hypothetical protein